MAEIAAPVIDPGQPSGPAMPETLAGARPPGQQRANDDLGDPFQKFEEQETGRPTAPAKPPAPAKSAAAPAKAPAPAKSPAPAPPKSAAPAKAPAPAKTPAPAKPDETKPDDDKPAEELKEPPAAETFTTPKALREAYEKVRSEFKSEKARYAAEVEQMRSSGKIGSDPAHAELQAKHKALEEKYNAIDGEMRYINYEKSSEFKEKFHEPYIKSWQDATAQLRDYRALNEDGTERAATNEDLTAVVRASSTPEARRIAKELFGADDAQDIVNLRAKIIERHRAMEEAKADYRTKGSERFAQQQREMEEAATKAEAEWHKLNTEAIEKHPEWFKAEEGDDVGSDLLKKGFDLADRAWDGRGLDPAELLRLRSAMRNRAGAFRYVAHKLDSSQKRIAELEAKIAEFENSAPGGGNPPGDGQPTGGDPLGDPFAKFEAEETRR